jgi:hypothetical protein
MVYTNQRIKTDSVCLCIMLPIKKQFHGNLRETLGNKIRGVIFITT